MQPIDKKLDIRFTLVMVLLTSIVALSIDTILPALSYIQDSFNISEINDTQLTITYLFAGLSVGQLIFGPMSDSIGRITVIYIGIIIFIIGSIICINTNSFNILLLGRILQGVGAASLRIMAIAMTRDNYSGDRMSQVMSIIMSIFIFLPAIAPTIGQIILKFFDWESIFVFLIIVTTITFCLVKLFLRETLHKEFRRKFNIKTFVKDSKFILTHKISGAYIICSGCIFGIMVSYLSSAQSIFQDYYDTGENFPIFFACSALSIGIGTFTNSIFVRKLGMRKILGTSLTTIIIISFVFSIIILLAPNYINLYIFTFILSLIFFCQGLCFGNVNSLALEPMGHIAGTASAILGSVSSAVSFILGGIISQLYNDSLIPFSVGIFILSSLAFLLHKKANKIKKTRSKNKKKIEIENLNL